MRKSSFVLPVILGAVSLLSSCSSIVSGSSQRISVSSNVNGAEVVINGNTIGKTPVTARVKREKRMHILVRKEGYKDYNASMETKLDPWFWGNVIIGGVLGSTTDSVLGSTHMIDPDSLHIQMEEDKSPAGADANKGKTSAIVDDKMSKVAEYSILSYQDLIKDIKQGKGDHIDALYSLKQIEDSQKREKFLSYLKSITNDQTTAIEFSAKVENYSDKI